MSERKADAFHQHEALHTAWVLMETWNEHVFDSKFVQERPDISALAEKASGALMDVYQAIGAEETPQ